MRDIPEPLLPWSIFRNRAAWYIALALLAFRLLLIVFAARLHDYDGTRYMQEAINLVQYGTFSGQQGSPPAPDAHDLPGYALVLAGLLKIFHSVWAAGRAAAVLNAVAFSLAAIELYGLVILVGGTQRMAAWAMVLFGMFPENIPNSIVYLPDSFFLAVFLASLLLTVGFLLEPRPAQLCLAFVLLGIAVLLRSVALFFAPVVVAVVVARYRREIFARRTIVVALLGGLLLQAAVLAPWVIRNYRVFGTLSFSSITGTNLFYYNYRFMLQDKGMPADQVDAMLAAQLQRARAETPGFDNNPMIQAQALQKLARAGIASDPLGYVKSVIKRHPGMYGGTAAMEFLEMMARTPHALNVPLLPIYAHHWALKPLRVGLATLLCLLYLLTVAGLVRTVRQHRWQLLLMAAIPLLYFAAIYGPVTGSRYRSVMTPFFAILATCGMPGNRVRAGERRMSKGLRVQSTA